MDATAPLVLIFRFSKIFGFFPFNIRKISGTHVFQESKYLQVYTLFAAVLFTLGGLYFNFFQSAVGLNMAPQRSSQIVLVFSNVFITLSGFSVFWSILRQKKGFQCWLNKIPDMFSHLKEENLRKVAAVYFCFFAAVVGILLATVAVEIWFYDVMYRDVLRHMGHPYLDIFIFFYYLLTFEIKMFVQLFCMFVSLIRFHYVEAQDVFKSGAESRDKQSWLVFLKEFRSRDLDVKDLVDFLNSSMVPVMSSQLLSGIFTFLFSVGMSAKGVGAPPAVQLLWALYVFWDTFLVIAVCHLAENKGNGAIQYLHELFIHWDDKELKNEIDLLSLQLQHRRLEFTALGCQRLNFSFVYWIVGLLASYAVVMAQFHIATNENKPGGCSC